MSSPGASQFFLKSYLLSFCKSWIGRAWAIAACSVFWVGIASASVQAQAREVTIEMPIYGQVAYDDLLRQAEGLISNTISQQFSQDAGLSSLQVVVVGNQNGEIIPIMTTAVSRSQWQQAPQVAQWTAYNSTAQTLFARFENGEADERFIASTPPTVSVGSAIDPVLQVEEAFQEGLLDREEYEALIEALD